MSINLCLLPSKNRYSSQPATGKNGLAYLIVAIVYDIVYLFSDNKISQTCCTSLVVYASYYYLITSSIAGYFFMYHKFTNGKVASIPINNGCCCIIYYAVNTSFEVLSKFPLNILWKVLFSLVCTNWSNTHKKV